MTPESGTPGQGSPPRFLQDRTAVLLSAAGPQVHDSLAKPGCAEDLSAPEQRLWEELLRRLAGGELRLYAEELAEALGVPAPSLGEAFRTLRQAGLVEWDDPGPYLYLCRPTESEAPDQTAATDQHALARLCRALEEATGRTVNPLELPRLQEWLSVLGLPDVLDEIALARERGPCRFSRLSFALDKACNRRRRVSAFGPLDGLGVVPAQRGGPAPGEAAGAAGAPPEAIANVKAYEPVPREVVRRWMAAHAELYDDLPPAPPAEGAAEGGGEPARRPAAWASAYDPVPRHIVRRWAEAFSADYAAYRKEYRLLSEKAAGGPFRRNTRRR